MRLQRRVYVTGNVQGVGFRQATQEAASLFPELRGLVRNLPDGRVEAVFQGVEREVFAMVSWCKSGPSSARVDRIEVREEIADPVFGKFCLERS